MFEGPIADRLAIRERIESYTGPIVDQDPAAWAENWAEESVWIMNPESEGIETGSPFTQYYCFEGKEAIVTFWQSARETLAFACFIPSISGIRVQGDTATARVYMIAQERHSQAFSVRYIGQYDDELVKIGTSWLFSRRTYKVIAWK